MKEVLAILQETGLDKNNGLWRACEKIGTALGNTVGNSIEAFCDALERWNDNLKNNEK